MPPDHLGSRRPYPVNSHTLGDSLRKKRIDLNLTQKQMAKDYLRTSVSNIRNWESGRSQISLHFLPKVYDFIGYFPCDNSLSIGQRLKQRRECFGLSIKQLSEILKVDSCTIAYWERDEHRPSQKSFYIIKDFLRNYDLPPENWTHLK